MNLKMSLNLFLISKWAFEMRKGVKSSANPL